jgi:hypothetical protein
MPTQTSRRPDLAAPSTLSRFAVSIVASDSASGTRAFTVTAASTYVAAPGTAKVAGSPFEKRTEQAYFTTPGPHAVGDTAPAALTKAGL